LSPGEQQSRRKLSLVPHARAGDPIAVPLMQRSTRAQPQGAPPHLIRRWLALALVLCIGGGMGFWALLPPSVIVVEPRRGPAVQAVYATGTVEPSVMVPIAARFAARLVELNADEGDFVKKGQLLARLENEDLRRGIEAAAAEERYAKAELDRLALLVERQITPRSTYDRARADWEKARAVKERALTEAGFHELLAPEDGKIIRRDGEIGQMIGPNQTVLWLSCCAPLRISTEVDEEDIARVRPGQQVLIRSDAFPGEIFHGQVQAITPKGDPVTRTYRVRVSLPADTSLMIGMTAETNIVLRQNDNALLLPAGAVQQGAVWVVEDGRLARREVKVGANGAAHVEILAGVSEGDRVAAAAAPGMKVGQPVRPVLEAGR
jgi:multidrug efflux system membrane fusion protein